MKKKIKFDISPLFFILIYLTLLFLVFSYVRLRFNTPDSTTIIYEHFKFIRYSFTFFVIMTIIVFVLLALKISKLEQELEELKRKSK